MLTHWPRHTIPSCSAAIRARRRDTRPPRSEKQRYCNMLQIRRSSVFQRQIAGDFSFTHFIANNDNYYKTTYIKAIYLRSWFDGTFQRFTIVIWATLHQPPTLLYKILSWNKQICKRLNSSVFCFSMLVIYIFVYILRMRSLTATIIKCIVKI